MLVQIKMVRTGLCVFMLFSGSFVLIQIDSFWFRADSDEFIQVCPALDLIMLVSRGFELIQTFILF